MVSMRRAHSSRRLPLDPILIGLVLATGVALYCAAAPFSHAPLGGADKPGAASASLPTAVLFQADQQDRPPRTSFHEQPLLAQSVRSLCVRRVVGEGVSSPRPQAHILIDLAPLHRRPPPSFSS
jgi:hypothetical protein